MKNLLLFTCAFLLSIAAMAQLVEAEWGINSYSEYSGNYCTGLAADHQGNVFVAGYFKQMEISDTLLEASPDINFDAFLAKYSDRGDLLWIRSFAGTDDCLPGAVRTDSKGNVYLTGVFAGSLFIEEQELVSEAYEDGFIAKFDPHGTCLFVEQIKANTTIQIKGFELDSLDNLYLLVRGWVGSGTTFGNITKDGYSLIAKYTSDGEVLWARAGGGTKYASLLNGFLGVSSSGEVYENGIFYGAHSIDGESYQSEKAWVYEYANITGEVIDSHYIATADAFIVKYNTMGEREWTNIISGKTDTYAGHVIVDQGKVYSIIQREPPFYNGPPDSTGEEGHFIHHYSSSGELVRQSEINEGRRYQMRSNCDYIYVAGNRNRDVFIDKYSLDMELVQSVEAGGSNIDYGTALAFDPTGDIFFGGHFPQDSLMFGNLVLRHARSSGFSLFMVKIKGDLGLNEHLYCQPLPADWSIYPNPTEDVLWVKVPEGLESAEVYLYNHMGQVVLAKQFSKQDGAGDYFSIHVAELKEATYFLHIESNAGFHLRQQFIKQ